MKRTLAIFASLLTIAAGCTKENFQSSVPVATGGNEDANTRLLRQPKELKMAVRR